MCCVTDVDDDLRTIEYFENVRANCPALREVLIPDDIWADYKTFCSGRYDDACHIPIFYLAFKRGYLAKLMEPIHCYCLNEDEPHENLTKQFREDLKEKWFTKRSVDERFKRFRGYQGKIAELCFAFWLESNGWKINNLEAWGGEVDISATFGSECETFFEVKHIGREEINFNLGVRAQKSESAAYGRLPVYSPVDYLLYRVYEAAKQLANVNSKKVVAVILEDYSLYFKLPLEENWVDWTTSKFLKRDKNIDCFLEVEYSKNPDLDKDIVCQVSKLDQIWFFDETAQVLTRQIVKYPRR